MPIVKSYYKLNEMYGRYNEEKDSQDIEMSTIVSSIATDILIRDPQLVVDTASGTKGKGALEDAIIHSTETKMHTFGFHQDELLKRVRDFMFGYGPLQDYIDDEDITDIDGTGYNEFSIKRKGARSQIPVKFKDSKMFETFCRLIIIRNGGIINENDSHSRVVDEINRLRINVSIPPRNINGPSISIRKHRKRCYSLNELTELGMLTDKCAEIMRSIASIDASVVFCGKGASGKTTLLRAFIDSLPEMERVLILESDSEIFPEKKYCIAQRIKKANEGGRQITLKELVADGLTMSLDTYCVGEIVGNKAWEFLKATFSGHKCLATTHSESAEDAMDRLLTLARPATSGESEKVVKSMIGKGIDKIVYLKDFKVVKVIDLIGYNGVNDEYITKTIWKR